MKGFRIIHHIIKDSWSIKRNLEGETKLVKSVQYRKY